MIIGTFHGIRVGLNRGPEGEWVYAFEATTGGVGISADEVEAMHETLSKMRRPETTVSEVLAEAVEAGRKIIAEAE